MNIISFLVLYAGMFCVRDRLMRHRMSYYCCERFDTVAEPV